MKAVMISIRPKWIAKIASGEKTVEVRKTVPKCGTPFKVYIYATKTGERIFTKGDRVFEIARNLTGKVVGEFVCDKVDDFICCVVPYNYNKKRCTIYDAFIGNGVYKVNGLNGYFDGVIFERNDRYIDTMLKNDDLKDMCLSAQDIFDYVSIGKHFYGLHISDLKIYDKPKDIDDFRVPCIKDCKKCSRYVDKGGFGICHQLLERPPQSWCYVEEL